VSKPFINHVELQDASVKEIKYVSDRLPDYIDVFTKKHKQIGLAPKTNKEILAYINTNLELLLVDNEYLIGYTIGESWFCKGTFLHED
ncbi:hypothetical protein ACS2TL_27170, partial [Bacillus cereus group sp. BC326]|uniref:hypothetical protein n=1 Tax=Bacillus cereus group sp. BC326 TaxID=3445310 RepID=UPI003F23DC1F